MSTLIDDVRTEALFVSDVQRSQHPTAESIRAAVHATVDRLGEARCAELVAQEFGEHPDCAMDRMRWARSAIQDAFAEGPPAGLARSACQTVESAPCART